MRASADVTKINAFMVALGKAVKGPGRVYLTGGATALLHGWRNTIINVDLKAEPEPAGLFEAIEPALIRYPAITASEFRHSVEQFCAR